MSENRKRVSEAERKKEWDREKRVWDKYRKKDSQIKIDRKPDIGR